MDNSSFQGQPPRKHHEHATTSQPNDSCSICNKPSGTQCILCDKCHKRYHFKCAKIADNQRTYTCNDCSKEIQVPDSPKSVCSHRSNASNSSVNSIIRKRNLELQRLEEERQLATERDRKYLKQKYRLLQQAEDEIDDTNSVAGSSVHEWLNNQPDPSINNAKDLPSDLQDLSETNYFASPSNNDINIPKTATENRNSTFTTNSSNQFSNKSQTAENMLPINSVQKTFQEKPSHVSTHSTSFNNTTTFINSNATSPSKTTAQTNVYLQAPANDTF